MKENVFARVAKENAIFKDDRMLTPEYIPEVLPHRENQINSLVYALKPLAEGGKPSHVFVSGPPGTGKTATLKFVMQQLKDFSARVKPVYFNCFGHNTRQSVLAELTKVVERPVPARGMSTNELYSKVLEGLKFAKFVPVIVLDEFDQLLVNDGNELLYDILRVPEHGRAAIPIVLISNDPTIPSKLDARVRSSLSPEIIEFHSYTPAQLKDILRERATLAFHPNVLGDETLGVIAAHASKNGGDCRIAIEMLRKAGKIAERKNSSHVLPAHAQEAFADPSVQGALKALPFLAEPHSSVLKALFSLGGKDVNSGEVYVALGKMNVELSERRIRELIVELETKRIITTKTDASGRGRAKLITVNFPESAMK